MKIFLVLNFILFWSIIESSELSSITNSPTLGPSKTAAALETILFTNGKNSTTNGGASVTAAKTTTSGKQQLIEQPASNSISDKSTEVDVKQAVNAKNSKVEEIFVIPEAQTSTTPSMYQYINKEPKKFWTRFFKVVFVIFIIALGVGLILCGIYALTMYACTARSNRYG